MFSQKITVFVEERQLAQFLIHNWAMAVYYNCLLLEVYYNHCTFKDLRFSGVYTFIIIILLIKFSLKYFGLRYK